MHNNNNGNKKRIVDCKIELKPKKKKFNKLGAELREEISPLHLVSLILKLTASDYFLRLLCGRFHKEDVEKAT
jgi:hypothetical protein